MRKSYLVILGVIGLFITITGVSFAYFMLNNSVNELETDVTAAIIAEVDFEGGPEVVVPEHGIYPGWIGVQEFTVKKPDLTSGKGSYRVNLETTIAAEFQDWITIEVYKTTDDKDTITRVEGEVVSDEINPNEIFVVDKITINGFTDSEKKIMNTTVINSTSGTIEIDEQEVDMATMTDVRYYIVYRFTNAEENQNAAQGANFKTKVTIDRGASIATYDPTYKEGILVGSDPVLDSKMIPVVISDTGVVVVADTTTEWYNYTNSEWANAVILNTHRETTAGEVIEMTDIAQMYVWIPRYEYSKSSIESAAHAIDVTFVPITKVNTDIENNDVIVHPAFTFGTDELSGLWVGKFELGWQDGFVADTDNNDVDTTYIIKPNVNSVHYTNVSTMFYNIQRTNIIYSLDATTDVHMMKNTEWGLTAYLSQSKYGICNTDGTCTDSEGANIKIENNNYYNLSSVDIITGCGGDDTVQGSALIGIEICPVANRWETINGVKASTTHNITGIYDMAGGRYEYVMGNMEDINGKFYPSNSGVFEELDSKYYDIYENGTHIDYTRGIWGDATEELNPDGDSTPINGTTDNWNNDYVYFVYSPRSWFLRSGGANNGDMAGVWRFTGFDGINSKDASARAVLAIIQ